MNRTVETEDPSAALTRFEDYDGTTYYDRPPLKPAPFDNSVVGAYIFIAGTSGSAAILAALADGTGEERLRGIVRRGRYLAVLAPLLGAPLLIYDLHMPQRFYFMLRVAKATSPMSIGTWILIGFSSAAGLAALAQAGADLMPQRAWPGQLARFAGLPAAIAGAGLSFYTAALLAATSTPVWAAAPRALAIRFAASSMASGAAALALGETDSVARRKLAVIQAAALATEMVATDACNRAYAEKKVSAAFDGRAGAVERIGAVGLGLVVPLGLLAVSTLLDRRRAGHAVTLASLATLAGAFLLRRSMLDVGDRSAADPRISFGFATPRNLPQRR